MNKLRQRPHHQRSVVVEAVLGVDSTWIEGGFCYYPRDVKLLHGC